MRAEVVFTGTELLLGQIINTNAPVLLQALAALGINVYRQVTVGDNLERLSQAICEAARRADVVIIGGGLGPTEDDLTREALSHSLGLPLEEDAIALENATRFFLRRGLSIPPGNYKQGLIPQGGQAMENPLGTAPGIIVEHEGRLYAALPGPPREFEFLLQNRLLPHLQDRGHKTSPVITSRTLKLAGIGESAAEEKVKDLLASTNPTLAPLAQVGEVHLRITAHAINGASAVELIDIMEDSVRQRLGSYIYGKDGERLEDIVGRLLVTRKLSLAVAESCSGGLLAHRLTNIPGSSHYFKLGVVAYANEVKVRLLGVEPADLTAHGAVSEQVARAMARGVRKLSGCEVGVGITGIAGPQGGTAEKPVGLVYLTLDFEGGFTTRREILPGGREDVKERASQVALTMLWRQLKGGITSPGF